MRELEQEIIVTLTPRMSITQKEKEAGLQLSPEKDTMPTRLKRKE